LASYDAALPIEPADAAALNNRGTVLKELKRHDEALASYDRALAVRSDFADALYNRANLFKDMRRYDDALAAYDAARLIDPDHPDADGMIDAALAVCDWSRIERLGAELATRIEAGTPFTPFALLGFRDDPALHLKCAKSYIADRISTISKLPGPVPITHGDKIRIAYLSADFHEHATAFLIAGLFELHDRARFAITGVSFGREDDSAMRR